MLAAPFPYFGGKSAVADVVWEALGDVPSYVEPFFGSGAVLLGRPDSHRPRFETVNDLDGHIANIWRSIRSNSPAVERAADWPLNETDMRARCDWLLGERDAMAERLAADPAWCDPTAAGWWVWGQSCSIPGGWGRKNPNPSLGPPQGVNAASHKDLSGLAARLRNVRVLCGDWKRLVASETALGLGVNSHAGVFLDPPYGGGRAKTYDKDSPETHKDVLAWCAENGGDRRLRIVLAGYEGEHDILETRGWRVHAWRAVGGMGNQADGRGRANAGRERLWMSPGCLTGLVQVGLFG